MPVSIDLTGNQILSALRNFMLAQLDVGFILYRTQANRVPPPKGSDYGLLTPLRLPRLGTNVEGYKDNAFTGSITGAIMTITAVIAGAIAVGSQIMGNSVTSTSVLSFGSGTGGEGTYNMDVSQTVADGTTLSCGQKTEQEPQQCEIQIDFYGPNAQDNATKIATLFRSTVATEYFVGLGLALSPLYAGDPAQGPFIDGEMEFEDRWRFDCVLQSGPIISVPQQFFDQIQVGLKEIDAEYPPVS